MSTPVPPRGGKGRNTNRNRPAPRNQAAGSNRAAPRGRQAAFQQRRRRQHQLLFGGIGLVVVVAIVLVVVSLSGSGNKGGKAGSLPLASPAILKSLEGVAPQTLASQAKADTSILQYPAPITGAAPLTAEGKPKIVYIGAEYCPYCAGERWAMIMALSKFGTFTGLKQITSSSTDNPTSVPTFSFYGSTYKSPYLVFDPTETETVQQTPLQTPTKQNAQLETKYDAPPYTQSGGIPFIDFANKWVIDGASYDVTPLQFLAHDTVAHAAASGSTKYGADIQSVAGVMVSRMCNLTGGRPGTVCKYFPSVIGGKK